MTIPDTTSLRYIQIKTPRSHHVKVAVKQDIEAHQLQPSITKRLTNQQIAQVHNDNDIRTHTSVPCDRREHNARGNSKFKIEEVTSRARARCCQLYN